MSERKTSYSSPKSSHLSLWKRQISNKLRKFGQVRKYLCVRKHHKGGELRAIFFLFKEWSNTAWSLNALSVVKSVVVSCIYRFDVKDQNWSVRLFLWWWIFAFWVWSFNFFHDIKRWFFRLFTFLTKFDIIVYNELRRFNLACFCLFLLVFFSAIFTPWGWGIIWNSIWNITQTCSLVYYS